MDWQTKKAKLDKLMAFGNGHLFLGSQGNRTPEEFYSQCWSNLPRIRAELKERMSNDNDLLKHLNGILELG